MTEIAKGVTGVLVLADGTVFQGRGHGAETAAVGEVCFNTAMTGYQEILTDPSYMDQIITFTFPHIGNVGVNDEDLEQLNSDPDKAACGVIFREAPTEPANWRSGGTFEAWLKARKIDGLSGIDTARRDCPLY